MVQPGEITHQFELLRYVGTLARLVQKPAQYNFMQAIIMGEFLLLLLSTALVNNVVLIKFLGLCPVMGVSKSVDSAFGMGLATTFVITLAAGA